MNLRIALAVTAAAVMALGFPSLAAAADAKTQLKALVEKINTKLSSGATSEKDLAEDLKAFDALLAEHHGEKTDDVAEILFMKALLHVQVLRDTAKGNALLGQLVADFPGTEPAKRAANVIESLTERAEADKLRATLKAGVAFPDFAEKDLEGKPLSVGALKGKVVLVDFWATWCGPCVAELPNVLAAYTKYHDKGFEIIGISLDEDRAQLTSFLKTKGMSWPQYFDGKGWQSKLARKYAVGSIPMTYLIDKEGKIIGDSLRGEELQAAIAKALQ